LEAISIAEWRFRLVIPALPQDIAGRRATTCCPRRCPPKVVSLC
jgi:hypothetical protein